MASERGWPGPGHLDGKFVEIRGIEGAIEAQDCSCTTIGEAVDPNGRRGWAHWFEVDGVYVVDTLDGITLGVPEANLEECSFVATEDGGYDLLWPSLPMAKIGASFALKVADTLRRQGCCVIDMPGRLDASAIGAYMSRLAALAWTHPGEEVAEVYMGEDTLGLVSWLDEAESAPFGGDSEFASRYEQLASLSGFLAPLTESFLGFRASPYHGGTHIRRPTTKRNMMEISEAPATEEQVASGLVEKHLDFARRRRICMMYFTYSQESVELRLKADPSAARLRLPLRGCSRLVLFRHDLFSYRYAPMNGSEVLMQTWILEEPPQLEISGLQGSQRSLEAILGGPSINSERQVHIMDAICRFPGGAYRMSGDWCSYVKQTDTFVSIPIVRFDIDLYWEPAGQFNSSGKSSTRHCGLLFDHELIGFDNGFFDMEAAVAEGTPCIQRVLLELTSELFSMVGFGKEKCCGQRLYTAVADIGLEWDPFHGARQDPTTWLKAAPMQVLSVNRLCHNFNLQGPAHQVDTACSASLVAANLGHAYLRKRGAEGIDTALAMGLQHILLPWAFIGLSGAGMLGSGGRCKTFDQSANGYNRGEGCGGLFSKVSDDLDMIQERIACYCGSYVNQDGRSASLTAPNGPSQQLVIRGSLQQADIQPDMVCTTENHGTGTALGDPIETGSIRAVFRRRDHPLPVTSAKTHMGHLEAGAGVVGILKNLCSLMHAATPPNCHLRQPNAHCEFEGFPGMFPVEVCSLPHEYHYGGCNGFGFGGTNSRCDMFAHRRFSVPQGVQAKRQVVIQPHVVGQEHEFRPLMPRLEQLDGMTVQCARCMGPMCWLCSAVPLEGERRHHCSDLREEAASYDYCSNCYAGRYLRGGPVSSSGVGLGADAARKVYLRGSWSGWQSLDAMRSMPGMMGGEEVFQAEVMLGDTRVEQFYVELHSKGSTQVIQPVSKRASPRICVGAPSAKLVPGMHWLIDGYLDGASQGTMYSVRLVWGDDGLSVTWSPSRPAVVDTVGDRFRHKYFLVSSLGGWRPHAGSNDPDERGHWLWFLGRVPPGGKLEFMFARDEDMSQLIYPMQHCPQDESVAVAGPDDGGDGRRWELTGEPGEKFTLDLRVNNGQLSVSMKAESMGRKTFFGITDRTYHVVGSWSGMQPRAMRRDPERPQVWRLGFEVGEAGREEFQIWANQSSNLRIYPAGGGAPGEDLACGPDRKGLRKYWQVAQPPGTPMEIVLDLAAEDHFRTVACHLRDAQEEAA